MNYQDFPIFKGITPEAAAYLDRLDNVLQNNNIKLDSQELLIRKIDIYYNYQEEAKKNNGKFAQNTEDYLQSMGGEHGGVIFPFLVSSIYGQRRQTKNDAPTSAAEYAAMLNDWKQQNNGLEVIGGDNDGPAGWIHKIAPQNNLDKKAGKPMHRFVLNVDPDKELLGKLDDFALKYGCEYKCAETQHIAYSRPDTIVIYTADTRFEEQKQELSGLVKQRTRKNGDNMLDGEKIADGLYTAPERNRRDIKQLIQQAQTIYPRLAKNLQAVLDNKPNKSHPLSLGEFTVYSNLLESFKQLQEQNSRKQSHANEKNSKLQTELQNGVYTYFYPGAKTELPEVNATDNAHYKLDAKNPSVMNISGYDINGRVTFSISYNKDNGYYTYQGGKPEKTYSNNPALNFPPLPDKALAALKKNQKDTLEQIKNPVDYQLKIEQKRQERFAARKKAQEKQKQKFEQEFNQFVLNREKTQLEKILQQNNKEATHPASRQPVPGKKSWKEKLKNLVQKTAYYGKELIKEVLLAPYNMSKEIYNAANRMLDPKQMPIKQKSKYDWRNNPQRMALVSLRYNRMLNRQKTAPQQRKDLALFIQSMRNGTNNNLQTKPTVVKKAPQQDFSLQLYRQMAGRDGK